MKVADSAFFEHIRNYLCVYLPKVVVKKDTTITCYRNIINRFLDYLKEAEKVSLAGICLAMFTAETLRCYLEWMVEVKGYAPTTRNQHLSCVRSLCRYVASEDIAFMAEYARMQELARLPVDTESGFIWLSREETALILGLPDATTTFGLRDLAYLTMLYDSAARDSELRGVRIGDIRRGGHCSIGVTGKGGKFRTIPISREAAGILERYLEVFHADLTKDRYLFYTARCGVESAMSADNSARINGKYEKLARLDHPDIPHLHPHLWRHSRAQQLYQAGMPLPLLAEWLGHAQMETVHIYARADTEMKRKAMEAAMGGKEPLVEPQTPVYNDDEILKKLYGLN